MAKRDNPRLKQQEAEKQQKRDNYLQAQKTRAEKAVAPRFGKQERPAAPVRGEKIPRPRPKRPDKPYHDFASYLEDKEEDPNLIIGRNPVMEILKSDRQIEKLLIQKDAEGSIRKITSMAREKGVVIQYVERIVLDKLCPGRPHQGAAAYAAAHAYCEMEDILAAAKAKGEDPFVIVLDGLEDPHNLGAIIRTADAAGAHGIVIPNRRSVGLTETVAKASAGAIEYVPVAKVGNIVQAIESLKEKGLWIAGCDMEGQPYYESELTGPIAVVVGGEGQGVSRLVREKCDFILSIPMKGKISSLNASNAAAILLYEVCRKREGKR